MPIKLIDQQRRLVEVGRIRMGEKIGNRPSKRETWRITSRDRVQLEAVQKVYPGELRAWNEQWELLTSVDSLAVMVLPGQTMSQWMEMWSAGGCQRRCDGERTIVPDDGQCLCPADPVERKKLAQAGRACKETTRLSVLLPDVAGIGCWRWEGHGYYSAVELNGIAQFLENATRAGIMLPARLRIDQRSDVKGGQTRKYPVAVLDVEAMPQDVMAIEQGIAQRQIEAAPPLRELQPPAAAAGDEAGLLADAPVANGAGSTDEPHAEHPPQLPDGAVATDSAPTLSEKDRRYIFRLAREKGMDEAALRVVIERVTGQTSTAAIPKSAYAELKTAIVA